MYDTTTDRILRNCMCDTTTDCILRNSVCDTTTDCILRNSVCDYRIQDLDVIFFLAWSSNFQYSGIKTIAIRHVCVCQCIYCDLWAGSNTLENSKTHETKVRATVLLTLQRVVRCASALCAVTEWFDCARLQKFVNELAPPSLHERTTR